MGEATDLEILAVALYESHVRHEASRKFSRLVSQPVENLEVLYHAAYDWCDLPATEREKWREKAREMIREAR